MNENGKLERVGGKLAEEYAVLFPAVEEAYPVKSGMTKTDALGGAGFLGAAFDNVGIVTSTWVISYDLGFRIRVNRYTQCAQSRGT